ncbi:solute carrier organic anion transporter family member 6A1-like [Paramacrobiotus metropolitanus]|uniref:solute carrier organic anion transporter family member 6A1-like n=1 Tax=Paramacrobiotus metropolitanus TaxID=2943436 RepID=UPI0024458A4D|nr:solute carrier organic anion transporter family member 6A1-like [Paramacrobiotus metropolitanus]
MPAGSFRHFRIRDFSSVQAETALFILLRLFLFILGTFTGYSAGARSCISATLDINDSVYGLIVSIQFCGLCAGLVIFSTVFHNHRPMLSALTVMSNGIFIILIGIVLNHYNDNRTRSGSDPLGNNESNFNATALLCNEDWLRSTNHMQNGYRFKDIDAPRTGVSVTLGIIFGAVGMTAGLPMTMILKRDKQPVFTALVFNVGAAAGMLLPRPAAQSSFPVELDINANTVCSSGFILCGCAIFLLGACFSGFPSGTLLNTDDPCVVYIPGNRASLRDCLGKLGILMRKCGFWCVVAVIAADCLYISVYINIFPKFLSVYFDVSSLTSGIATSLCLIFPYGLVAALIYVVSTRWHQTKNFIMICTVFVCTGHFLLLFVRCESSVWNQNAVESQKENRIIFKNICNDKCGCQTSFSSLRPVCHKETKVTFASPCHAGCFSWTADNETFTNCECVLNGKDDLLPPLDVSLSPGVCSRNCSVGFWMTILITTLLISFGGFVPLILLQQWQKMCAILIGASHTSLIPKVAFFCLILLFGIVPAPIISGLLLDSTCVLKNDGPSPDLSAATYTTCLLHTSDKLGNRLYGLLLLAKIVIYTLYFTTFKYNNLLHVQNNAPESSVQYRPIVNTDTQ